MEWGWMIFAAFLALALLGLAFAFYREKKRREAMKAMAEEMSFDFYAEGNPQLRQTLGGFELFSYGNSSRMFNTMIGRTNDLDVAIFDYTYTSGSGKNRSSQTQTVVSFRFDGGDLPAFNLRPESFVHRIAGLFGYHDIDFSSHPRFSSNYLLRGENEESIRAFFTPELLDFFETKSGICVEGKGDRAIFYRLRTRSGTADIHTLMEDGFEILGVLRQ